MNDMQKPTPEQRMNELGVNSVRLVEAIEELGRDTGTTISVLRTRAYRNRAMLWGLAILAALQIAAITALAFLAVETRHQNNEIQTIQTRTSDKVLCPLYGAFLAAANNPVPDELKNDPAQLREREEAFRVIEDGYKELECK